MFYLSEVCDIFSMRRSQWTVIFATDRTLAFKSNKHDLDRPTSARLKDHDGSRRLMQPFVHLVIAPVIHAGRRKHRKQPHHMAITLFGGNYGLSSFSCNHRACGAKWKTDCDRRSVVALLHTRYYKLKRYKIISNNNLLTKLTLIFLNKNLP